MTTRPQPPQFDQQAAQDLISALNSAIHGIRSRMTNRATKVNSLQEHWRGGYADQFFEADEPGFRSNAADLISQIQAMIKHVSAASDQASSDAANWASSRSH